MMEGEMIENGRAPAGEREYFRRSGAVEEWLVSGADGVEYVEGRYLDEKGYPVWYHYPRWES